jgi:hypothetical protein
MCTTFSVLLWCLQQEKGAGWYVFMLSYSSLFTSEVALIPLILIDAFWGVFFFVVVVVYFVFLFTFPILSSQFFLLFNLVFLILLLLFLISIIIPFASIVLPPTTLSAPFHPLSSTDFASPSSSSPTCPSFTFANHSLAYCTNCTPSALCNPSYNNSWTTL